MKKNDTIEQLELEPCDKKNPYATFNLDALVKATNNLSMSAFQMWLYLSKNRGYYIPELTPQALEAWGMSRASFFRAKSELIEKGYLTAGFNGPNSLIFSQVPVTDF